MPIRWRLTAFNTLVVGTILVVLGLSLFLLLREALLSRIEDTTRDRALATAEMVEAGESIGPEEAERLTLGGVFVIFRDGRGRVIDQTVNLIPQEGGTHDSVWQRAVETGRPAGGAADLSPAAPDYVYAVPVDPPGGRTRVVEAGQSYQYATSTLKTFAAILVVALLAALLLSAAGAYLLARAALSPVDAAVSSAREITEGDLGRRLPVGNRKDEVGRLATTVNHLLSRLEAAFARREEALARQRRFAADASHELRTPLTSIVGYTQLLGEWGLRDPETAQESVAAIGRESERLRRLAEDLLDLARGDEGAPMEVRLEDLGAVAAEAMKAARAAANGKVAVGYVPPEAPVEARFDRNLVHRAALVLLDNAVKYTPEGGKVTVTAREREGWAEIRVSDTGIGIPEEQLPLVFERFHRADPARAAGGGAGLGLAIARQIAEAHGGGIEVESVYGEGSRFALLLPKEGPASGR